MNKTSEKMLSQMELLISEHSVQQFIDNALSVPFGQGYPYLSYFGLNYDNDQLINIKIYFAFFRRLLPSEVGLLLPDSTGFYKNYLNWEESQKFDMEHMGCSFSIKMGMDMKPVYYYHFRTNQQIEMLPGKIILTDEELMRNQRTFCVEYKGTDVFNKNYFFIFDHANKKSLLKKMGVSFFENKHNLPYLLEYTETNKWDKIILAIDKVEEHETFRQEVLSHSINQLIDHLAKKYDVMSVSPGFYSDGKVRSIYFVDKNPLIYLQNTNTIARLRNTLFARR